MNKIVFILITLFIINSINAVQEYYQHRNCGLQIYSDIIKQAKFKNLETKTNNSDLKNLYSLLSFAYSIESLSQKKLYEFTKLLEQEYVTKKTIHHFTDLTLARIFLEKKYPHLNIGTNKWGLSNVFTNIQRIEDYIFNLNVLQNSPNEYAKLIEELYKTQEKNKNRHAELNFTIAMSLANPTIQKQFKLN